MKKTLLFAILALSINAFAQSKHPSSNSMENVRGRMGLAGRETYNIFFELNYLQAIKHQTPKQRELIQIFDSIYHWRWDTVSIGWKIFYKEISMVYDANHNLTSFIGQSWNGSAWVVSWQYLYTYDTKNNLTSFIGQSWNGSTWVNYWQYLYTYDANNNLTSEIAQNPFGNAWVNYWQNLYTYDANNNQTSYIKQNWNSNTWVNSSKSNDTYDANNNLTSEVFQTWNGSAWMSFYQSNYTYDVNNKRISGLSQMWNGSAWVNSDEYTYTYDANNNLTSELDQSWNDSAWVNFSQYLYNYDTNNNKTGELDQSWNNNAWVNSSQNLSAYDANNFRKSQSTKIWNSTGIKITNGDSSYYYFHTVAGINDLMLQDASITVYPNPSSGKFTISSKINISSVEIYNLLGERINSDSKFNRQTSNEIDFSDHCKGIYFIKIYCGTEIYCRKIVVQ